MEIVRQLDERLWREFVDHHPQSNIFHTPEMFQVFSRAKNHLPELWAATQSERVLALLLPVRINLLSGLFRFLTTRAVVYGGVLCAPGSEGQEALATLLRAYNRGVKRNILFTELRNLSDSSDLQAVLNACGFAYENHLNFLIDLDQPEETLWQKISKSGRQKVRSSHNKGTVIEDVTERQNVATIYHFLQSVYERVRIPLADPTLFEAAFDVLAPCNMLKIWIAYAERHPIGTRLLLMSKGKIIDWYAGSDRTYSSYCPEESLVWHSLTWGKQHQFHQFDFGGAGRPDEEYGPRMFKFKFGGTLVDYGRNTCIHAPVAFEVSKTAYALMRRFLPVKSVVRPML